MWKTLFLIKRCIFANKKRCSMAEMCFHKYPQIQEAKKGIRSTLVNSSGSLKSLLLLVFFVMFVLDVHPKKLALLIGISDYPHTGAKGASWSQIHGANDVNLLSPTLLRQGFSVTELLDDKATGKAIRSALTGLVNDTKRGDIVYIHFSGHGQPYEDISGDEADGWDEAIVPYDAQSVFCNRYKGENHIIDDELEKFANRIRLKAGSAGFVYVVLDACHMGGASRGVTSVDSVSYVRGTSRGFSPNGRKYIPQIDNRGHLKVKSSSKMASVCYIEACRAYQTNVEIKEGGTYYGSLSYYVNKSIKVFPLTGNTSWVKSVENGMAHDNRLIKQNMVIETSR